MLGKKLKSKELKAKKARFKKNVKMRFILFFQINLSLVGFERNPTPSLTNQTTDSLSIPLPSVSPNILLRENVTSSRMDILFVSGRFSGADLVCSGGNWRARRSLPVDRALAICSAAVGER